MNIVSEATPATGAFTAESFKTRAAELDANTLRHRLSMAAFWLGQVEQGNESARANLWQMLKPEAEAEAEANAAQSLDEDQEGLIELLAQEEEARQGYGFLCTYGPGCDF